MRLAFGVWRLAFREIGIALGENNSSEDQPNNYHREIAKQRGKRQPSNAERQTPNEQR
jgi:hypothetical protein